VGTYGHSLTDYKTQNRDYEETKNAQDCRQITQPEANRTRKAE